MSFTLDYTNRFKKDVKICLKRNCNINLLEAILLELREKGELPLKHKPHI
jgi:mRNA interferase YafQ